ncbi:MAG: hypothetical protein KDN18_12425 [Verrucomicrobiae bacterium]|nr:hypothetical protein [Verrucomicrobiae bacterium]
MKTVVASMLLLATAGLSAGDWGKAPVDKTPIEECLDLGGLISVGYHSSYIFKGYVFGQDAVSGSLQYSYDGLALPLTLGVDYVNVVAGNSLANVVNDDVAVSLSAGLPSFSGIDSSLSFTYHFYPEDPNTILWPSSHGEIGWHASKDFDIAVLKFDLIYNNGVPNAWNGTLPMVPNNDNGSWYWDLGLERAIPVFGQQLVLGGGVAYADNYWGTAPNFNTGGSSSGWNHYYLTASLPIELNCRAVVTPYIGYIGAPEGWLLDGAPNWLGLGGQSDVLHGGVNFSVSF